MSSLNRLAIGGYPELELPQKQQEFHKGALKYQSARAAFTALLLNMPEVKRVWVPAYICNSMLAPIKFTNKEIVFFNINKKLNIESIIELKNDDLLLYVNYFGVCDANVYQILEKFNRQQVIIDCSQAFFSAPYDCLATIYSPRKFFGIPDGGLIFSVQEIVPPNEQDDRSLFRMEHLITRLAVSAEAGYASYQKAEASLEECSPKEMSSLTKKILETIDYSAVQAKRVENFRKLHYTLGPKNELDIDFETNTPLCYPFFPKEKMDKKYFAEKKIFIPTYWEDAWRRGGLNEFEYNLFDRLLPIPCGQLIGDSEIILMEKEIKSWNIN